MLVRPRRVYLNPCNIPNYVVDYTYKPVNKKSPGHVSGLSSWCLCLLVLKAFFIYLLIWTCIILSISCHKLGNRISISEEFTFMCRYFIKYYPCFIFMKYLIESKCINIRECYCLDNKVRAMYTVKHCISEVFSLCQTG